MARVASVKQYNAFVKGIITEASPLTYPENASLDEDNFVLKRNGSRERRLGLNFETAYSLTATGIDSATVSSSKQSYHKWENPGGAQSVSIGVIRIHNKLWFIDLLTEAPSANLLNGGSPITIAGLSNADMETAVINNIFIIVSADIANPIKLEYDITTDTVSQSEYQILVRDLWGIDDGLATDARPATLSNSHKYNLRNQGWNTKIKSVCGTDVIDCTKTKIAVYPSNADIWTLGKAADATSASTFEKYDPIKLEKNSIDNSLSAKGSYIIDAFRRGLDRQTKSGLTGLPLDMETRHLTTTAAYAGRIFYSGILSNITEKDSKSPNYSGFIFFSQNVQNSDNLGKCYQEADPTSENISDIVDTDGGVIQIPEASHIYKLVATQSSLLVFAENGIWEIFGDTQGFVATSYQVSKVSSTGCTSPKSIIEALGTVFAWTRSGIYVASQEQTSGRYKVQNSSLLSVQSLYNNLSDTAKNNAKGFYDEKENTIRWLYNDQSTYSASNKVNSYNREIILDLTLQAFYLNSFDNVNVHVADYVDIPSYSVSTVSESVYADGQAVVAGGVQVVVPADNIVDRITQFSFLAVTSTSFTLAKYADDSFYDWKSFDGIGKDYLSFLLTGAEVFGDLIRNKQIPYIWFYFTKTEDGFTDNAGVLNIDNPSSCYVSSQWAWADSPASGKWTSPFQAYRFKRNYLPSGPLDTFDNGFGVVVTKSKLRGHGRSLSILIQSETGKDMKLLGWAVMVSGESTP